VDPTRLSRGELERLTRRYAFSIGPMIGPDRDIPAPDINTDAQVMSWIMDTVSMMHGHNTPGVVTGKLSPSVARSDTPGRRHSG